jgi:hypothetical protein
VETKKVSWGMASYRSVVFGRSGGGLDDATGDPPAGTATAARANKVAVHAIVRYRNLAAGREGTMAGR